MTMKVLIRSFMLAGFLSVCWGNSAHADSCCEATTQSTTMQLLAGLSPRQVTDFVSPWLPPEDRMRINPNLTIQNQDGELKNLGEFKGRILIMGFMYTRCVNVNKCPLVVASFCNLRKTIQSSQFNDRVSLVLVTYDPNYDTPEVLTHHGDKHGFDFDDFNLMARPTDQFRFFDELEVAVNYYDNGVSIHQNELIIIDQNGALARRYRRVMWDNSIIIDDISLLVDENDRMK